MEKKRIIWCDYAAAFQAALECVNTKQSQDFAIKFVPKALPYLTGEGDPPPAAFSNQPAQAGSAWDDWCGEYRRKGNHPAGSCTAAHVATKAARRLPVCASRTGTCCALGCSLAGAGRAHAALPNVTILGMVGVRVSRRSDKVLSDRAALFSQARAALLGQVLCTPAAEREHGARTQLCCVTRVHGKYEVTCMVLVWAGAARNSSLRWTQCWTRTQQFIHFVGSRI